MRTFYRTIFIDNQLLNSKHGDFTAIIMEKYKSEQFQFWRYYLSENYPTNKNNVCWIREEDNKKIVSHLTVSDFHFLKERNAKLILKPIEDLTEDLFRSFFGGEIDDYWICRNPENDFDFTIEYVYHHATCVLSYLDIQKLFDEGFDLFGLIKRDLAINVNEFNLEVVSS